MNRSSNCHSETNTARYQSHKSLAVVRLGCLFALLAVAQNQATFSFGASRSRNVSASGIRGESDTSVDTGDWLFTPGLTLAEFRRAYAQTMAAANGGDLAAADAHAQRGLVLLPSEPGLQLVRALNAYAAGDLALGIATAKQILRQYPGDTPANLFLADVAASQGTKTGVNHDLCKERALSVAQMSGIVNLATVGSFDDLQRWRFAHVVRVNGNAVGTSAANSRVPKSPFRQRLGDYPATQWFSVSAAPPRGYVTDVSGVPRGLVCVIRATSDDALLLYFEAVGLQGTDALMEPAPIAGEGGTESGASLGRTERGRVNFGQGALRGQMLVTIDGEILSGAVTCRMQDASGGGSATNLLVEYDRNRKMYEFRIVHLDSTGQRIFQTQVRSDEPLPWLFTGTAFREYCPAGPMAASPALWAGEAKDGAVLEANWEVLDTAPNVGMTVLHPVRKAFRPPSVWGLPTKGWVTINGLHFLPGGASRQWKAMAYDRDTIWAFSDQLTPFKETRDPQHDFDMSRHPEGGTPSDLKSEREKEHGMAPMPFWN